MGQVLGHSWVIATLARAFCGEYCRLLPFPALPVGILRRFLSSAIAESAVNQVVSKRLVKKQQMQWTPRGAHLLLQTRTRVLNGELEATFRDWYPAFRPEAAGQAQAVA